MQFQLKYKIFYRKKLSKCPLPVNLAQQNGVVISLNHRKHNEIHHWINGDVVRYGEMSLRENSSKTTCFHKKKKNKNLYHTITIYTTDNIKQIKNVRKPNEK